MGSNIFCSHKDPIREGLKWEDIWHQEDMGLIACWEVGRVLARTKPELAEKCLNEELPILGWKGGVDEQSDKKNRSGTLKYLAQWQGLRGEDLNIDTSKNTSLTCSKTGISVLFKYNHSKTSSNNNLGMSNSMRLNRYRLKNFRRFDEIEVNLENLETIYVGANNAGKTSATEAFRLFIGNKREFKVHDFPSKLISKIDKFGEDQSIALLPTIELELWFTINPETEYGRVANFLPVLNENSTEIGIKLVYSSNDSENLLRDYKESYELISETQNIKTLSKSLSYYLAQEENLKKHFSIKYFMLEQTEYNGIMEHSVDSAIGRNTLKSLIRVDFVEAQRNIDDNSSARSNRLSQVFYDFYQYNLDKHKTDFASIQIIERSNESLSEHYAKEFKSLISTISDLGFPSANDRELRIISNLNPEKALSGNTALTYFDKETEHMLPESYNGLGFKNLIYMAIQVAHFQIQWFNTESSRPLCQIIFIEEPEAHLHAQVQQTFIKQIRTVIQKTTSELGLDDHHPQLVVTTHSSHIVAESDFGSIRYFRRGQDGKVNSDKASSPNQVLNLAEFAKKNDKNENLKFLKKYLALTHCDLFFSDAAIIVEGTVERILLPGIIKKHAAVLNTAYVTTLELGGAFAHKFIELIKFLDLPCLVITDLDSVDPAKNNSACIASQKNSVSSNASIGTLLLGRKEKQNAAEKALYNNKRTIENLVKLSAQEKKVPGAKMYVTFQQAIEVSSYGENVEMIPRTFEEAFIYTNIEKIKTGEIDSLIDPKLLTGETSDHDTVYNCVVSGFRKVEFALTLIEKSDEWIAPSYIVEGLSWLSTQLSLSK
jgi:predicted ATP-dependent endonuclease of OLD family